MSLYRPPARTASKNTALYIRLSPDDLAAIKRAAAASGKSVSEYIRTQALRDPTR